MNTKKLAVLVLLVIQFSEISAQVQTKPSAVNKDVENPFFLIPYRVGDKWGLSDTIGNIKVKPEYDGIISMESFSLAQQSFYYFTKNGKTILADHNNTKYFQEYDSIDHKQGYIYKNGKVGAYKIVYRDFYTTKRKDTAQIIVEPIYDKLEIRNSYYLGTINQKVEILREGYNGTVSKVPSMDIKNRDLEDIAAPVSEEESRTKSKLKLEQEAKERQKKTIINITRDANKEDLARITPIEFTPISEYIKFRENGKVGLLWFFYQLDTKPATLLKKVIIPARYDSITEMDRHRYMVKLNGKYGVVTPGKEDGPIVEAEIIYDDIVYHPNISVYTYLLKKGKKYAVYSTKKGKTISDFEYDGYQYSSTLNPYDFYLVLKKKQKKNIIRAHSDTIFKTTYDDITIKTIQVPYEGKTYPRELIKVRNGNKYGVLNLEDPHKENVEVPCEFDDVTLEELNYYTTVRNGLKGAIFPRPKINIAPKYTTLKRFGRTVLANNHTFELFEVTDVNGTKFLVDASGKEYYAK